MKNLLTKIVFPLLLSVGIGGCSETGPFQKHIYSGVLKNEEGVFENINIHLRKESKGVGATFEICVDKKDNSGQYLVCYEDKPPYFILDEIWINGENHSSNKRLMAKAQEKYFDYLKRIYDSQNTSDNKETKGLIDKL
jgi:hypothetical protein